MVKDLNKILSRIYTNPSSSACFSGVESLFKEARKHSKHVTRKLVRDFLSNQRTYTLHKRIVRKYKHLPTLASGLHTHWQADLCDMQKIARYNDKNSYIFVCIDTLSRQIFATPIKRKTAEEMIEGFKEIFKKSVYMPWMILSDEGKEFTAASVQDFFKSKGIQHFMMYTSPQFHAGMVERANRTLKERLYRYFTETNSCRWVDVLQKIVNAINHSVNTGIGMRPADVTFANCNELRTRLAEKAGLVPKEAKFDVGDIVRIEKNKHVFTKGYLPNFTKELFIVSRVQVRKSSAPVTYRLTNSDGDQLKGWFYAQDLCRVGPHLADDERKTTYPVEEILKSRVNSAGITQHYVKWLGYGSEHNSWVDEAHLYKKKYVKPKI